MLNRVFLIGNLGRDPELKESKDTKFCKLSVATSSYVNNAKETEWHNVTCFGKTAENVAQWTRKGSQVFVEGRIQSGEYTTKEGEKRKTYDIIAQNIRFLDSNQGKSKEMVSTKDEPDTDF